MEIIQSQESAQSQEQERKEGKEIKVADSCMHSLIVHRFDIIVLPLHNCLVPFFNCLTYTFYEFFHEFLLRLTFERTSFATIVAQQFIKCIYHG